MSIIHDALKKVQQGKAGKADNSPAASAKPAPTSGYIYATPEGAATPDDQMPIEQLISKQNKAKSVLTFILALAFTLGSIAFLYRQVNTYLPNLGKKINSSFNKLIHKKEVIEVKSPAPSRLPPLAKITVNPPKPMNLPGSTNAANPANPPVSTSLPSSTTLPNPANSMPDSVKPNAPTTLNIHGVMSNGSRNVVLIDDQVYQEGDDVDGVKIVKISLDSITVNNNGVEQTIHVKN